MCGNEIYFVIAFANKGDKIEIDVDNGKLKWNKKFQKDFAANFDELTIEVLLL